MHLEAIFGKGETTLTLKQLSLSCIWIENNTKTTTQENSKKNIIRVFMPWLNVQGQGKPTISVGLFKNQACIY